MSFYSVALLVVACLAAFVSAEKDVYPLASAIVIRHCARAPGTTVSAGKGFSHLPEDYIDGKLPDFGVAPWLCTENGKKIVEGQSKFYRSVIDPKAKIDFIVDACQRDITTAECLSKHLGVEAPIHVEGVVFDPVANHVCESYSPEKNLKLTKEWIDSFTFPSDWDHLIQKMQNVLGNNTKAGPLNKIPNLILPGYSIGQNSIASYFAELFLLEQGANITVGFDRIENYPTGLYDLLRIHSLFFKLDNPAGIVNHDYANLLFNLTQFLSEAVYKNEKETRFYVGHDSDISAISTILDLAYEAYPFPTNATVPGSALRFDVFYKHNAENATSHKFSDFEVSITYDYPVFTNSDGHVFSTPVTSPHLTHMIPLHKLISLIYSKIDFSCVKKD